jgi:ring-1,2-phenylacetyl-CoA epoxidase subunit PaaD
MSSTAHVDEDCHAEVWRLLGEIPDPEIPILSILDLGIVRYVRGATRETLRVGLTPTYSACPATEAIHRAVSARLNRAGFTGATVETVLSPPWSSDAISAAGRAKLAAYGIAPPAQSVTSPRQLFGATAVACPHCHSTATRRISEFGSTPCKAHYTCTACLEPFDYFKCI